MPIPRRLGRVVVSACLILCGAAIAGSYLARDKPPDVAALPAHGGVRPNVVVIVLDTTRGDRCSVNGYPRPTTPALEELGAEGAVFRDCWSPSPWTAPAHASLFTGLRPANHGLIAGRNYVLHETYDTLAERLSRAGYATACFTANDFISAEFGLTQGFDAIKRVYDLSINEYPFAPGAHDRAVTWALRARAAGRPFFVFINDIEPHTPYTPPADVAARFVGDATAEEIAAASELAFPLTLDVNVGVLTPAPRNLQVISRLYDAEIATVDAAVGRLVGRLRSAGALDDTIVVVVGDHGENLGERGQVEHMMSIHRTLLHVPLVIRYPPAFTAGQRINDVVRLEDVHTTVLELCGIAPPPESDGLSLLGSTSGRVARATAGVPDLLLGVLQQRRPAIDARPYAVERRSVYDGRHHLLVTSDGRRELYDVRADPLETTNIAGDNPDVITRLEALLDE